MIQRMLFVAIVAALPLAGHVSSVAAADPPYKQTENIVFAETDGIGLLMDIFQPTGEPNGLAIVDVASGAWHSDRGKIRDHKQAQIFDIMCARGFTVFAVRPGSLPRFSVPEMLDHVKQGIRWVKDHADEYEIDPNRIALCGASAGGHLASLAAVTADEKSEVAAVVAFFPPTDFTNWAGIKVRVEAGNRLGEMVGQLLYPGGVRAQTKEEIEAQILAISPAKQVKDSAPPFLLIHGDADFVVPLQQSKIFEKVLQDAGIPVKLIVKPGGGHPWITIHEEVAIAADWLEEQLVTPSDATSAPSDAEAELQEAGAGAQ